MELTIKKIGFNRGSIGWLAAGLADGSLIIKEGRKADNGNHALFFRDGNREQMLACQNFFGLTPADYIAGSELYKPILLEYLFYDFTPASWRALMNIAQQWCESCNEDRNNEQDINFTIARIEVSEQ